MEDFLRAGEMATASHRHKLPAYPPTVESTRRTFNSGKRRRYVSLASKVHQVASKDAKKASMSVTNSLILQKWEHPLLKNNPLMKNECEGDVLVKRINSALKYLDEHGFERSSQQRLFHHAFMQSTYAQLYGQDLHRNLIRLLEDSNTSELRTEVACLTPRRFGKTFAVALWCASMLVCAKDHDSSIYSTSARVSKMLLQTILRFVAILQPVFGGKIVAIDKNEYVIYRTADGIENSCHAYPAKSETLRGTGSKRKTGLVVLEEAAFIPPEVTTSIVAPTLTRDNVNLICISTINSEDVIMRGFMDAKNDDGSSIFMNLNFSLVCSECRALGREDTCKHMMGELPHWSSAGQHKKLNAMLKSSKETLQREIKGLDVSEQTSPAFNARSVRVLEADDLSLIAAPLPHQNLVFVTVDPACGGHGSAMAIVSCVYINDNCIVIGGEEVGEGSKDMDRKQVLKEHIREIRMQPEFAGSKVVVCVESNLGAEAENYCNFLRAEEVPNLIIMQEDKDQKDGWRTTDMSKEAGVIRLNQILNERRLKFYEKMLRVQRKEKENTPHEIRMHISEQLQAFMCFVLPKKNLWDELKRRFSGKLGGRDDLAMAMMIAVLSFERFRSRLDHYMPRGS